MGVVHRHRELVGVAVDRVVIPAIAHVLDVRVAVEREERVLEEDDVDLVPTAAQVEAWLWLGLTTFGLTTAPQAAHRAVGGYAAARLVPGV